MNSYDTAVERIYALGHELTQAMSRKFDLEHMRVLLSALQDPHRKFPAVLVAGTNGKGSTSATLAAILQASGLKTGLYTSPHLVRINERIRVNGAAVDDDRFALLHELVDRTAERLVGEGELPWHPSFFEMLTAMAMEHFAQQRVDVAVLEVGMGGRLDATNVVEPLASVITDISLDHQKYLGNTVAEIAREKAGIIRRSGVVVTLPQSPEANDVIGNAILEAEATVVSAVSYVPPVSPNSGPLLGLAERKGRPDQKAGASGGPRFVSRYPLQVMGEEILVETPLLGRHQLRNVALAVATAERLAMQGFSGITASSIEAGIRRTQWPGRFQVLHGGGQSPEYVFDVAHNPAGAWALRSTLSAVYDERRMIFVFGAMQDKAIGEMAEILFPLAETVIAAPADNPRSATPAQIREAAHRVAADIEEAASVTAALARASDLAGDAGLVVVTGSIYIVGQAMRALGARV